MAESMKGLHRTHRCTEVSSKNIGETVTVMGWVQKRRNLGSLIFIDLRDRSGLLQLIFDESQKESDNEIWIDLYAITSILEQHQSAVLRNSETKEFTRQFDFNEIE